MEEKDQLSYSLNASNFITKLEKLNQNDTKKNQTIENPNLSDNQEALNSNLNSEKIDKNSIITKSIVLKKSNKRKNVEVLESKIPLIPPNQLKYSKYIGEQSRIPIEPIDLKTIFS